MIRIIIEIGEYKETPSPGFWLKAERRFAEEGIDKNKILRNIAKALNSMIAEIKLKEGVR